MSSWQVVLLEPARQILAQVGQFLIRILGVLVILLIGWLISMLIKAIVVKVLKAIKVDELSESIKLDAVLDKGGVTGTLSELLGGLCYWIALLVSFMVAVEAAGLTVAADLLGRIIGYVPNVVAAIFILILGMFAATLLRNIVLTAANNAGLMQSKLLGKITEIVIFAFALFVALEQLNIGIRITELTLAIILGSIGLGAALAFGLGCRDLAEKSVSELIEKIKSKK